MIAVLFNRKLLVLCYILGFFLILQVNAILLSNRNVYNLKCNSNCMKLCMTNEVYNNNQIQKKNFVKMAKAFARSAIISSVFLRQKPTIAADSTAVFPECSESIVVLRKGTSEAIVIGTAHISDESAKLVQRTIRNVSPDIVMIELDAKRIGKFAKNSTFNELFLVPSVSATATTTNTENGIIVNPSRQLNLFTSVVKQVQSTFDSIIQTVSGNYFEYLTHAYFLIL